MGSAFSSPAEMDDPRSYRSALQASPSVSPGRSSDRSGQEEGVRASSSVKGRGSHRPDWGVYDDDQVQNNNDHKQQQAYDDDTPPATPTTFTAQARHLHNNTNNTGDDHRRLSSLCLDIREAAESRGGFVNRDVRRACIWLLNREGVPQRLRWVFPFFSWGGVRCPSPSRRWRCG